MAECSVLGRTSFASQIFSHKVRYNLTPDTCLDRFRFHQAFHTIKISMKHMRFWIVLSVEAYTHELMKIDYLPLNDDCLLIARLTDSDRPFLMDNHD